MLDHRVVLSIILIIVHAYWRHTPRCTSQGEGELSILPVLMLQLKLWMAWGAADPGLLHQIQLEKRQTWHGINMEYVCHRCGLSVMHHRDLDDLCLLMAHCLIGCVSEDSEPCLIIVGVWILRTGSKTNQVTLLLSHHPDYLFLIKRQYCPGTLIVILHLCSTSPPVQHALL